jgi:hypothetical protein
MEVGLLQRDSTVPLDKPCYIFPGINILVLGIPSNIAYIKNQTELSLQQGVHKK